MAVALRARPGAAVAYAADHTVLKRPSEARQQWSRASCYSPRARDGPERRIWGLAVTVDARKQREFAVVKAAGDGVEVGVDVEVEVKERGDVFPSDQWPENFSLLNFEDLSAHYEPSLFKAEAQPETYLADVMSKTIYTASPDQTLSEVDHFFKEISGFPVIDKDFKVVGVVSKKDMRRASDGERSKVSEVMSSPVITLSADKTVKDAAVLMLKNKIHRIPIVNSASQVVGIVTRTDIFTALQN